MDTSKAIEFAEKYIGQTETPGNSGFIDSVFQEKIVECGWDKGEAWCAYFVELVWKEAFPELYEIFDELFSSGAVRTWNNFRKYPGFICDEEEAPGAIVIWQNYKNGAPHWTGHAGILIKIENGLIYSIDGNTNKSGSREGVMVDAKIRKLNFLPVNKGLVCKGFIKII